MALNHHTSYKNSRNRKVYGKISVEVHKPNGVLIIKYNALDQKVSQSTSRNDSIVTEYFIYGPSGNVLATYGDTIKIQNFNVISHKFSLHQLTIYGSSRIGTLEADSLLWKDGSPNVVVSNVYTQKLGLKRYELSNHLGNVQTVVSDRKSVDSHSNGQITAYKADVISVTDYYPFGMKIEERSWNRLVSGVEPYRFGFNGKDFFSDWNRQDYGFRVYDDRKCRFESVDPLHSKYPELTSYQFASNRPIDGIDQDGLEFIKTSSNDLQKHKQMLTKAKIVFSEVIYNNTTYLRTFSHVYKRSGLMPGDFTYTTQAKSTVLISGKSDGLAPPTNGTYKSVDNQKISEWIPYPMKADISGVEDWPLNCKTCCYEQMTKQLNASGFAQGSKEFDVNDKNTVDAFEFIMS